MKQMNTFCSQTDFEERAELISKHFLLEQCCFGARLPHPREQPAQVQVHARIGWESLSGAECTCPCCKYLQEPSCPTAWTCRSLSSGGVDTGPRGDQGRNRKVEGPAEYEWAWNGKEMAEGWRLAERGTSECWETGEGPEWWEPCLCYEAELNPNLE